MQVGVDACTSGNITTTRDNDLLLACLMETTGAANYGTVAVGTGFTLVDQADCGPGTYGRCTVEQKICGAAGVYAGTFTHTVQFPNGIVVAAAFKRMQLTDELAPTFPATPILDTATRANENPATGWTGGLFTGYTNLQIVSNRLSGTSATSAMRFSKGPYRGFTEMYCTFENTTVGDGVELMIEHEGILDTSDYYTLFCSVGWPLSVYKGTNGANSQMGADIAGVTVANGDSVGFRRADLRTLEIWYKKAGGLWRLIDTRTDSGTPHAIGGYVAMIQYAATVQVKDVGGGAHTRLNGHKWQITGGSVGAALNDQATFKEYTFKDEKTVRKDWK
jgi:hypothetical protein